MIKSYMPKTFGDLFGVYYKLNKKSKFWEVTIQIQTRQAMDHIGKENITMLLLWLKYKNVW